MTQPVLLVDDDEQRLEARAATLRAVGSTVVLAHSAAEAIELAREAHPGVAVIGEALASDEALALCRRIKADRSRGTSLVLLVSAAFREPDARAAALDGGADACLAAPVHDAELCAQVRALLRLAMAEATARRAEHLLRAISDSSSDVIFGKDTGGRLQFANPATLALIGKPLDEVLGRTDEEFLEDKEAARRVMENDRRVMESGADTILEEIVPLPDGTARTWLSHKVPYRDTDGRVAGLLGISRDITDRKLAEERLQASEARYRALFQNMTEGFALGEAISDETGIACDFRFVEINAAFERQTGLTRDILGRSIREVLPNLEPTWVDRYCNVAMTGEPVRFVDYNQDTGRHYDVFCYCPAPGQFAIVFRDVTDEKRASVERERLYQQAAEANRLKDEFLATLSHELRTPLTAILGWARLLDEGTLSETAARQAYKTILRNAEAQRQLVTDVLDMSRVISGKMRLDVQELDAAEIVELAIASIQPAVQAKDLRLDVRRASSPAVVMADPDRLQQIVWNLLSNAVKFTPPGGAISVDVRRGANTLDIVVADTGIGIRRDFLARVFERFVQGDSSTSRRYAGLGLGLSIVGHLVELHGGVVRVESEGEGRGSRFTVSLPLRAVRYVPRHAAVSISPQPPVPSVRPRIAGLQVLVVDDLEDARTMIATVLESAGGEVRVASSGEDALAQLSKFRPQLVLADIGMPGMDGYEFVRRLRARPAHEGGDVAAIALTAFGGAVDRARALAAGFDDHLAKPVLPEELLVAAARAAGRTLPPPRASE